MILSTINRTIKSYALAIVGAEYIARIVPKGKSVPPPLASSQPPPLPGLDISMVACLRQPITHISFITQGLMNGRNSYNRKKWLTFVEPQDCR